MKLYTPVLSTFFFFIYLYFDVIEKHSDDFLFLEPHPSDSDSLRSVRMCGEVWTGLIGSTPGVTTKTIWYHCQNMIAFIVLGIIFLISKRCQIVTVRLSDRCLVIVVIIIIIIIIKAASSDEPTLAGRACRPAVPLECPLTCYLHGEKRSSKHHVNWMMFVWLPVSSGWCYGYDTVLMHRYIQGDSLDIP